MEFRRLVKSDLDSYFAFRMRALQNAPTAFLAVYEQEHLRGKDQIEKILSHEGNDAAIIAALDDGKVVGSMGVFKEDEVKFIHKARFWEMYVDSDYRGRGIAAKIFEIAVEHARSLNVQLVKLSVESENHNARKLYETYGFRVWGTEPKAMKLGNDLFDVDHMMLQF